jgi:hypothetical protein
MDFRDVMRASIWPLLTTGRHISPRDNAVVLAVDVTRTQTRLRYQLCNR